MPNHIDAEFTVRFRGEAPADVKVGDVLQIGGKVTVHSIIGDLADVRTLDEDGPCYLVGSVGIGLYANRLEVSR